MKVRGVNLGNWLVLEKWMGDSPLSQSEVSHDDHDLVNEYADDPDLLYEKLEAFRSSYVTRETIVWLKEHGCNMVRVGIPYHICGSGHHKSCSHHLNNLFDWCDELGVGILIDLHSVQYGHNASQTGGYIGMCRWHQSADRVNRTISLLCRLAGRYRDRPSFWGIDPLSEPSTKKHIESLKKQYANDPILSKRINGSSAMGRKFLCQYYSDFYNAVMPIIGDRVKVVFHDNFFLPAWNGFMSGRDNVVMDTHKYPLFESWKLKSGRIGDYLRVVDSYAREIEECSKYHPIIVGEWCLAEREGHWTYLNDEQSYNWHKMFAEAQLDAWDRSLGGFFWSLRQSAKKGWSAEDCIKRGWLDLRYGI